MRCGPGTCPVSHRKGFAMNVLSPQRCMAALALLTLTLAGCGGGNSVAATGGGTAVPAARTAEGTAASAGAVTLLNVSYDPTRELYTEFNQQFAAHWKQKTGQDVTIEKSHGGAGKQ